MGGLLKDFVAIFSLDCHFKHFCGLHIPQEERHDAIAPAEDYCIQYKSNFTVLFEISCSLL
jgi:hypothetical protein